MKFVNKSMLNYFVFINILNFLFTLNLFADFFKFFKCGLLIIILENLQKIFVNNEKTRIMRK